MDNSNKYLTTGEFAKLFGINKKTLFHYDEIGLFSPEKVTDNNYRYYSYKQIDLFYVIMQLKTLQVPLKDIKHYIKNRTPQMALEFFNKEKLEIDKNIQKLLKMKEFLDTKTSLIESGLNVSNEIVIKKQHSEKLFLSDPTHKTNNSYDIETYTKHFLNCFNNDEINNGFPIGSIIDINKITEGSTPYPDYYFSKISNTYKKDFYLKPEGLYVIGYIKSSYNKTHILYDKILKFADNNNILLEKYAYEEYILDEICIKDPESIIIKISIKIKDSI